MSQPVSVTAIVVTFNSAPVITDCVRRLIDQGVDCLVVDNASTDGCAELAAAAGANVVRNARNEGYGRANNIGLRACASDYVLIVNPDIAVDPGCVPALLKAAADAPRHGLYAPRLVEPNGRMHTHSLGLLGPSASGACLLARRQALIDIGGFDEEIFLFY